VLRLSGAVFAFCVLAAGFSFAQSLSGPSPSSTQSPPLRGFVPPYEILRTVRAAGFDPLAPPLREGTTYVVRAIDFRGVAMRVVVDARSGAIRDANRIVSGPGLYGPYAPGPYPPLVYGRLAAPPPYPPSNDLDDSEPAYGRPSYLGGSRLPPGEQPHFTGIGLVPQPRPRPASLEAPGAVEPKPMARPDVAISAPVPPASLPSSSPSRPPVAPPIND
jgi:hypothetical protein